jgi:hypothetical protein
MVWIGVLLFWLRSVWSGEPVAVPGSILLKFDQIKEELTRSPDKGVEAWLVLHSLLDETAGRYQLRFDLPSLTQEAIGRLDAFSPDPEVRAALSRVLSLLCEADQAIEPLKPPPVPPLLTQIIEWPWFKLFGYESVTMDHFDWFTLQEVATLYFRPKLSPHAATQALIPAAIEKLPDDLLVAGIEIIVAALLFSIPSAYTHTAGIAICYDGLMRGLQGVKKLSASPPLYTESVSEVGFGAGPQPTFESLSVYPFQSKQAEESGF